MPQLIQPAPEGRPVANWGVHGSGTADDPAYVTFHILGSALDLEELQEQLPSTVSVAMDQPIYKLTPVDPTMSRNDIAKVFTDLCSTRNWRPRFFG